MKKATIFSGENKAATLANFRKVINEFGTVQSFSVKRHLYGNTVMEYFFKYLKRKNSTVGLSRNQTEILFFRNFTNPFY